MSVENIATLREAAQALRTDEATTIELAVSDWLLAEAAVIEVMPPFTELFTGMRIEFQNGLESALTVGRMADGKEQIRASSTPHGLAVALAVLEAKA